MKWKREWQNMLCIHIYKCTDFVWIPNFNDQFFFSSSSENKIKINKNVKSFPRDISFSLFQPIHIAWLSRPHHPSSCMLWSQCKAIKWNWIHKLVDDRSRRKRRKKHRTNTHNRHNDAYRMWCEQGMTQKSQHTHTHVVSKQTKDLLPHQS